MKFSLPGQMGGPEGRRIVTQAVALRKRLEPWFANIDGGEVSELGIALRVDGSLTRFGPEGIENVVNNLGKIECDVVIGDKGWSDLEDHEIASILRDRVVEAIGVCLDHGGIDFDRDDLLANLD